MCGIFGYVGKKQAQDIIFDGLSKLEYRGYDSAGISVHDGENIYTIKAQGRLKNLEAKSLENKLFGSLGIGHTRWATHGVPSDKNSHPHMSHDCKISIVHNGIIENYLSLKKNLKENIFLSDTDSEVIAHLINKFYIDQVNKNKNKNQDINNLIDAVYLAIKEMRGSYALGILCKDFPDKLIAVRKDNPLVIGIGEQENFIASDITAIVNHTRDIYLLENGEVGILSRENIKILDENKNLVEKKIFKVNWNIESAERGGYKFFMLKEIFEQPKTMNDLLSLNLSANNFLEKISLEKLKDFERIYFVACGTAYHAGLIAASLLSHIENIFVSAEMASEFRYNNPVINNKTLVIIISQSGETADTLAALRMSKNKGAKILSIVNVVGSSIARESHSVIYTAAGPEIAVASTKAFSGQVIAIYILIIYIYKLFDIISAEKFFELENSLREIPKLVSQVLARNSELELIAKKYITARNIFYIGRNLDYFIALEGSLKLKEIAYLYSQVYAAGELKHGPIALIDNSILIIGIITQENILEKTLSNLKECKARYGKIFLITTRNNREIQDTCDDLFIIPKTDQIFQPIIANICLQLFAYHIADNLNCDIDKPKNLAKSVTVE